MLTVHRAERSDTLVAALADHLRVVPGDPFEPVLVAVPSKGVERWLAQRLGHVLGAGPEGADGVCANVTFPSSSRLLDDAAATADADYGRAVEQWNPAVSTWPLLRALDTAGAGDPWHDVLSAHLGAGGADSGRRYGVASRLARLFDRYGRSRPDLLVAWAAGDDSDLPEDLSWQPALWRRLREAIGPSPAELLDRACAAVTPGPGFSVFGATRLSPARVRVLHALGRVRDVRLWLHHPSPAMWAEVAARRERPGPRRLLRAGARHPLLASTARDVRELQQLLASEPFDDVHHPAPPTAPSLLGDLQEQLRLDRPPARRVPADSSLQVHTAHGAARQVEVVREVVLGLLAADPTLEPRDVVVMCPDVETFAPLVNASFGMTDEPGAHPAAALRVSLADRSLRQTNPLLRLMLQLLDLAGGRITASAVLDLASAAPVRRRFRFDDDDLERLRDWTVGAGARWGLDRADRVRWSLDTVEQGTWRWAMDRLLLGATMEDSGGHLDTVVPVDDVDSGDIDLVGRFAEFVDRVDAAVRAVSGRATVPAWAETLTGIVTDLGEGDAVWQAAQVQRELDQIAEGAVGSGADSVELGRADIVAMLGQRLAGRPTRSSFRTGTLTVCTLVPMRAVPHRVVVLLGMDDTAFPRRGTPDGDDLLARDPRSGERDPRSEDRQLFLDAIGAATDHLVVVYTGHDPRTGAVVPPCVPVGELLDALDATVQGGAAAVVRAHALQPFDPRNFAVPAPFSFDPSGLAGAEAARGPRTPAPPLLGAPLPPPELDPTVHAVELDELVRFFEHPVKAFLRQRLEIATAFDDDEPSDSLPIETRGLPEWKVGARVLAASARPGADLPHVKDLEMLRGDLPPGALGAARWREIGQRVVALLAASREERQRPAGDPVDVRVDLGEHGELVGTVGGVHGRTVLCLSYSSIAAKHRLAAWIRHLAVVASRGEDDWTTVVVGRWGDGAGRRTFAEIRPGEAREILRRLVTIRALGLCEPLPLFARTSAEYAEARRRFDAETAFGKANRSWATDRFTTERSDSEHVLAFPGVAETSLTQFALGVGGPAADPATYEGEATRFGALARLVWEPLLAAERAS
ncbi:exodeoxyribonuclease V subunit gamma [Jatrophihabitans sp. YIM 134969]